MTQLAGENFLHSNYPKGNSFSIDHIQYKNWFNSKHLKWAFILQLISQQTGIHSMTGTGQNTWRYFISMDESHWVKWYWVWLPQTVPQSWFSCSLTETRAADSTTTNFSLAWSQDTAWGAQPCPRMYFPASKVIHPWETFLDKSVKERWQLSSSDDFTCFCFQVLIPSALAL